MRPLGHVSSFAIVAFAASLASAQWDQSGAALISAPTHSSDAGAGYEATASQGGDLRLQSGFLAHRVFHVNVPFVVADIQDQKMPVGGAPIRIALADVFAELDGDSLRFDPSLEGASVSAAVVHDSLVLTSVAGTSGYTTVSVNARDGDGSASSTFKVYVEPSTSVQRRAMPPSRNTGLNARVHGTFAPIASGSSPARLGRESRPGQEPILGVDILLPGPSKVSVAIFDNMGTPVTSWSEDITARALAGIPAEPDGRKPIAVTWNLRTPDGRAVPSGVYLWRIVAKAANGEELETVRRLGVRER